MPALRSVAKVVLNVSTFLFCMIVLFQALAFSQESRNLLNNGGFENQLTNADWNIGRTTAARETTERIELDYALAINHGDQAKRSWISQRVKQASFSVGERFVLSANTKIDKDVEGQAEKVYAIVRFHRNASLDKQILFEANGDTSWKKLTLHFTVPPVPVGKSKSLHVFLMSENTTNRTWFDHVQLLKKGNEAGSLLDGNDAVNNGDFDDGILGWDTNNGGVLETDPAKSNSGTNSLKIVGKADSRFASQFVSLKNRGFDPDKPVYTVSANIKTRFSLGDANLDGTADYFDIAAIRSLARSGTYLNEADVNRDGIVNALDVRLFISLRRSGDLPAPTLANTNTGLLLTESTTLPQTSGKGANVQIVCFRGNEMLRTFAMPYFRSKSNTYHERKLSFLVPQGTDGLVISLHVAGEDGMVAHFDDIRLVKNDVVDTSLGPQEELIRDVGHQHNVVEAPEVGTSVNVADYASIQAAIDEVSDVRDPNFGKIVWIPAGLYEDDYRIFLRSGLHLKIHKDAMFVRVADPVGPRSMWHGAFIRNQIWQNPISDVIIDGGSYFNLNETAGSPVAVTGDRIVCRSFNILSYATRNKPASALYFLGYDISVHHNSINGAAGFEGIDGIHLWGGGRAHIMCNDVLAGDDGIGLFTGELRKFPGTDVNLAIYNRDISAVECFNNRLDSEGARAFACGVVSYSDEASPRRLTSKVEDVRCRNFVGRCGGGNQMIGVISVPALNNLNLPFGVTAVQEPQIRRILIQNGNVKGKRYELTGFMRPPKGISVYTADVGSVEDVYFQNIKVSNVDEHPDQHSAIIEVQKSRWNGANLQQIRRAGHNNSFVRFKDCILDSVSLDENDLPDGGEQAEYLFLIDGEVWSEVYDPTHLAVWFNSLETLGTPSPGFGRRRWREERHSAVPGR